MDNQNLKYINIPLFNSTNYPILANVTQTRSNIILPDPENYEFSVIRAEISAYLIPLFYPKIPNPLFPTRTNMSFTLSYLGNKIQRYVNVTPDEIKEGVFKYTTYINEMNDALLSAFNAIKAAYPLSDGTEAPRLYLNSDTALISLYVQDSFLDSNINGIRIACNQHLQRILDFPNTVVGSLDDIDGYTNQINILDSALLLPVAPRSGYPSSLSTLAGNWLQVKQEFSTLDEWIEIKSIILATANIPIYKELLTTIVDQSQNSSFTNSSLPIITDLYLNKDNQEPRGHTLLYIPFETRWISLHQSTTFNTIDVSAKMQTYDGKTYDIKLSSGSNMDIKMVFRRKIII